MGTYRSKEDCQLVKDLILEKASYWKKALRIYDEVVEDYGPLYRRRFWRTLAKLVASGQIIQRGIRFHNTQYRRAP